MATDVTTITPVVQTTLFSGIQEPLVNQTYLARAEAFAVASGTIAAPGVGDNQQLIVNINMPANFAYAMVDLCLAIEGVADAGTYNFPLFGSMEMRNHLTGSSATINMPIGIHSPGAGDNDATGDVKATYGPTCLPKGLIQAIGGSQVTTQIRIFNPTADDIAYVAEVYARYMQFDLNQVNAAPVNSPFPTR